MADGQIVIEADMNIKKATAQLEKLNQKAETLKQKLATDTATKTSLEREIEAINKRWEEATIKMDVYKHTAGTSTETIRNQLEQIKYIQREWTAADSQLRKVNTSIAGTTSQLAETEKQAADAQTQLDALVKQSQKLDLNLSGAAEATRRFNRRVMGLMKRVFVFTIITKALRSVREWFSKITASNDELSGKLAQLKGSLLTAAQPILNVVIPAFSSLLSVLTKVISAIASVVSMLFGTTVSSSADQAKNLYDEANAIESVGGAAQKAEKQLASFDTINKLSDSSGGGGGGSASSAILPDFSAIKDYKMPEWLENFLTKLKFTVDDVIFDWKDLTGEQIAEKAIAGITALCGGVAGFMIAGVPGALVGTLLGLAIGLVIDALTFDHDGKLSKKEIVKMIILALGGIVGGILGFKAGKTKGALIGVVVGMSVAAVLNSLMFTNEKTFSSSEIKNMIFTLIAGAVGAVAGIAIGGGLTGALIGFTIGVSLSMLVMGIKLKQQQDSLARFYDTELGQWTSELASRIDEHAQLVVDLKARIDSITGEIDSETMADFTLAQQLIDQIFELDEDDNKTAAQIAVIKEKIEEVNGLGLDGLELAFDDATGHITATKEEVQNVMDSLLEQYRIEAMREAYIEAYKEQYNAVNDIKTAEDDLTDALDAQNTARDEIIDKQQELYDLMSSGAGFDAVMDAIRDLEDLTNGYDELSTNVETARDTLKGAKDAYDEVTQKVNDLEAGLSDLVTNGLDKQNEAASDGTNVMTGFAQGITEGEAQARQAIVDAASGMLEAEKDFNGVHSPSTLYEQEGSYLMQGLANGITNNAYRVTDAIRAVVNELAGLVERGINNIIDKYNGVAAAINLNATETSVRANALSRVTIPRLAQGAVIPANREFLAVLGDQKSGKNVEAPESLIRSIIRDELSRSNGGNGQTEAQLVLDGQVLGRIVYKLNKAETSRIGVNLVEG